MGDMGDYYRDIRAVMKLKRDCRLENAKSIKDKWTIHSPYHWSCSVNCIKLNWWPTTGKWSYGLKNGKPKMYFGTQNDLLNFIKNLQTSDN